MVSARDIQLATECLAQIMDYASTDPLERVKHAAAQRMFFGAPQPFYVGDEVQYDQACARMLDWFAFEYRDRPNRPTPFQNFCLRNHRKWSRQQRAVFERFRHNVYSTFEVAEVVYGQAMVLRDLANERLYPVREKAASCQVEAGQYIVGRLFPLGDEFILSGAMCVWPESARAAIDATYEKMRASGEWFSLSPLDTEAMLRASLPRDEIAGELEAEFKLSTWLRAFVPGLDVAAVRRRIRAAHSPGEVVAQILSECTLESERDAEGMAEWVQFLWDCLHGPFESSCGSLSQIRGPIERSLFGKFMEYVRARLDSEGMREVTTARADLAKLHRQWLNTRQKILGYRTPAEVIAEERQRLRANSASYDQ